MKLIFQGSFRLYFILTYKMLYCGCFSDGKLKDYAINYFLSRMNGFINVFTMDFAIIMFYVAVI